MAETLKTETRGRPGINENTRLTGRIRDRSLSENNFGAAVQAEKARGMAAGLYVSKSEIRHGSIDQMSKEEVEKALNDLKKQLGERVIEHQSERVELLETTKKTH